ncbi:ribosome maturation factor RimM [Eleftheria terrae]|uniref:ribosome maturation factor RimM n=1 Tax=Eleftheria terrae TaxID=1597781 RepID=UPI00263AEF21|nr:ribosome maturation factor RimM [Eleftheria terrae]WKB54159.1 ribosome maturation factor RimM [Eleftheria terrae]
MNLPTTSPDDAAWPEDAVEVGRIVDAYGIKGWIKVQPYSADPQALFSSRRWFLKASEGPRRAPGVAALPTLLKITEAKDHGDVVVARVRDVEDRNAAEALKGARVFVSRASFPTADPDEFYWVDLIGLAVVNRQGEALGQVADLLDTGAHSVLRVVDEAQASAGAEPVERLIPFVSAYVDAVDLAGRRITVDWGLDY